MLSVTVFVELLALVSTGYLVAVGCLFLGYFLVLDLELIRLFSVFDFTSQAVIVFPLALLLLVPASAAAAAYEALPSDRRTRLNRLAGGGAGLLAVVLVAAGLVLGTGPVAILTGALGDAIIVLFAAAAIFFSAFSLRDLRTNLARDPPLWSAAAMHGALAALFFGGGFVAGGAYWALADIEGRERTTALVVAGGGGDECYPAAVLKSAAAGILALDTRTCLLRFHTYDAVREISTGSCVPVPGAPPPRPAPCTVDEVRAAGGR